MTTINDFWDYYVILYKLHTLYVCTITTTTKTIIAQNILHCSPTLKPNTDDFTIMNFHETLSIDVIKNKTKVPISKIQYMYF